MDFEKSFTWRVSFLFLTGGHEAAGQCNIVAKTWDEVNTYAKEAPLLAIVESAEPASGIIKDEASGRLSGVAQGQTIDKIEIFGIEKINATLVPVPSPESIMEQFVPKNTRLS